MKSEYEIKRRRGKKATGGVLEMYLATLNVFRHVYRGVKGRNEIRNKKQIEWE